MVLDLNPFCVHVLAHVCVRSLWVLWFPQQSKDMHGVRLIGCRCEWLSVCGPDILICCTSTNWILAWKSLFTKSAHWRYCMLEVGICISGSSFAKAQNIGTNWSTHVSNMQFIANVSLTKVCLIILHLILKLTDCLLTTPTVWVLFKDCAPFSKYVLAVQGAPCLLPDDSCFLYLLRMVVLKTERLKSCYKKRQDVVAIQMTQHFSTKKKKWKLLPGEWNRLEKTSPALISSEWPITAWSRCACWVVIFRNSHRSPWTAVLMKLADTFWLFLKQQWYWTKIPPPPHWFPCNITKAESWQGLQAQTPRPNVIFSHPHQHSPSGV